MPWTLGMFGNYSVILSTQKLGDFNWQFLRIFGDFWEFLGISTNFGFIRLWKSIWQFLKILAIFRQFCAIFVAILRNFGDCFGNCDQFLVFETLSMILSTQKPGYFNWQFLGIFGDFWQFLGISTNFGLIRLWQSIW